MRLKEREIRDITEIEEILTKAEYCRIALTDGTYPYIVAVNFAYADRKIYFHCSKKGKKIDLLRKNNNVCIQTDIDSAVIPADEATEWTTRYRSVIGFGTAHIVDAKAEKIAAYNIIMHKFAGEGAYEYTESCLEASYIIRIDIDELTGKKNGV